MKHELRKDMLSVREKHRDENRFSKDEDIKKRLFSLPEFVKAEVIFFYVAVRKEVRTQDMIVDAIDMGKSVCVPATDFENKTIKASRISRLIDLEKTSHGLLEPKNIDPVPPDKLDLIIVPGIAFDREGNRLGYGSGFYDRFLPAVKDRSKVVALAYDLQIAGRIPSGEHDIKVSKIITEKEIIEC